MPALQPDLLPATGELRRMPAAPEPWLYRGELRLPGGRHATIEARVIDGHAGKYFELRAGLQPGMTAAELEEALTACEKARADKARTEGGLYAFDDEVPL